MVKLLDDKVLADCVKLAGAIGDNKNKYETIFPIPMGGYPIAVELSNILQIPISRYLRDTSLVVDDLIDSGKTIANYPENDKAVLYVKNNKEKEVTYFAAKKEGWLQFPWEGDDDIEDTVIRQIQFLGEDVSREGLLETPKRVVKSWGKLFGGYKKDPIDLLKVFDKESYDQMVLLKGIEFYSTCEHHILPFFGKAHIAYIPGREVIGISKLARLLEIYSRRLQIQERIGKQVTEFLDKYLLVEGAACILEAQHFCMTSRGIEKQHSKMVTSSLTGAFRKPEVRAELLGLIK